MTTSSFLSLAGGGEVRFDFDDGSSGGSISFQLIDAAGQPVGPVDLVHEGHSSSTTGQPFTHVDSFSAAALSGGGFALVYEERSTAIGAATSSETLTSLIFDAQGVGRGASQLAIGAGFANDAVLPGPGAFGLSDGRFAVLYDRLDGVATASHLSVQAANGPLADLVLPGDPSGISHASADLALTFADGSQVLVAGSGHSSVAGAAGADTVLGGDTADVLRGGDGGDSIVGGAGFDDINGNMGNDTCVSGGGDDWVVGGKDNDSLVGSAGQNLVYGNLGNDTCDGGAGNDIVRGGQDNDSLMGGAGDDFVSGDKGDDTMTGGSGADIFHTFGNAGIDRVLDFHIAEGDRVQLDPGTQYTVAQVGADTIISMTGGGQMILVGVQMSTLTGAWIFGA